MDISLVIPVFNEEKNIPELLPAIRAALRPVRRPWEVIFVDDGSSDGSLKVLHSEVKKDPKHLRVIVFRRNFGQTAAISAGIDHATGDTIVLMDADMQNDPADIPQLLAKLNEGFDVVSGWRKSRKDNMLTRTLPSRMANQLISAVTGVQLHDYGCTLKAYRRSALEGFRLYGEMHRFIPVFAHSMGARIAELPVRHRPRLHGSANYGLERTLKVILDLFTAKFLLSYSVKPMRLFGALGLGLDVLGASALIFLAIRRLMPPAYQPVTTSPFFGVAVLLVLIGTQAILMGLLAEMIARTYHESQSKLTYTIRETLNLRTKNA